MLPTPSRGDELGWVREHLGHLALEPAHEIAASTAFAGGQRAADAALEAWSVAGYAGRRNEVWPPPRRGASGLSPWIRHGLLSLPRMWRAVDGGPARDVRKFRDELLWQEYARHVYARLGAANGRPLRRRPAADRSAPKPATGGPIGPDGWAEPWPASMACMEAVVGELERDGWLVNQTRMWLASQWTIRAGWPWEEGDDRMFQHLLDGSRAANRLGWQWTVGAGTGRPYGFSRWQVEKRAGAFCERCELRAACPIQDWPDAPAGERIDEDPRLRRDDRLERTAGPAACERRGDREPEAVWLTAESLGDDDPALASHPDLPVVFVFDEPLLRGLALSGKRLVFLAQCLADLAERRELSVLLGDPVVALTGRSVAVTYAPVPGFRRRAAEIEPAELHPWPWLARPRAGALASYSAWRKQLPV